MPPVHPVSSQISGTTPLGFKPETNSFHRVVKAMASPFGKLSQALGGLNGYQAPRFAPSPEESASVHETHRHFKNALLESDFYKQSQGAPFSEALFEEAFSSLVQNPEALSQMKTFGLTISEAVAITAYTHLGPESCAHAINQAIRAGDPKVSFFLTTLNQGLEKLPVYTQPVYRCTQWPEAVGVAYQEGHTVIETGLCAASPFAIFDSRKYLPIEERVDSVLQGTDLVDRSNYHITIYLGEESSARDVSAFSRDHGGCVLLPPGTSFLVTSRQWIGDAERNHEHPRLSQEMSKSSEGIVTLTLTPIQNPS